MTDKDQPSTLKSYVDSATAAVQSAVGSITGNPNDKVQAEEKREHASKEYSASEAGARVGPYSFSSTGEVTKDNEDRRQGSWDETVGSVKKAVGNLTGSTSLKEQGTRQEQQGQAQKASGQLADITSGTADRVTGTVGASVASITKNPDAIADFQKQHDQGKTRVRGVQSEVNAER